MAVDILKPHRSPVILAIGESLDEGSVREAVAAVIADVSQLKGLTPEMIAEGKYTVDNVPRMFVEAAIEKHGLVGTVSEGVLTIVRSDATLAAELSPMYDPYGHEEKGPKGERVIRDYEI